MVKSFIKKGLALVSMIMLVATMTMGWVNVSAEENSFFGKVSVTDAWLTFDVWTGSGSSSVIIEGNIGISDMEGLTGIKAFEKLQYNEADFNSSNYTVSEVDGKTVITLKEEFIKTLDDGTYYFNAEFAKAIVPLKLFVVTHKVFFEDAYFDCGTWTGIGSKEMNLDPRTFSIVFEPELFENLMYKGKEVNPSNYTISAFTGTMTVTLKEEYLKTLPAGVNYFEADFMNVNVGFKLNVDKNDSTTNVITTTQQIDDDNPKTGAENFPIKSFIILSLAAVGCILAFGNYKKGQKY